MSVEPVPNSGLSLQIFSNFLPSFLLFLNFVLPIYRYENVYDGGSFEYLYVWCKWPFSSRVCVWGVRREGLWFEVCAKWFKGSTAWNNPTLGANINTPTNTLGVQKKRGEGLALPLYFTYNIHIYTYMVHMRLNMGSLVVGFCGRLVVAKRPLSRFLLLLCWQNVVLLADWGAGCARKKGYTQLFRHSNTYRCKY
jgi:hypothetical protein